MNAPLQSQKLLALDITEKNFCEYGQLILPTPDGKAFDQGDAQLDLTSGIPRFYIMNLKHRGRKFHRITRHVQCTQCLGSLKAKDWFLAVAPPTQQTKPEIAKLKAFRISGNCFLKLALGTWHAGPYFDEQTADFYNLELSDTNSVDHFTYDFQQDQGLTFEIVA